MKATIPLTIGVIAITLCSSCAKKSDVSIVEISDWNESTALSPDTISTTRQKMVTLEKNLAEELMELDANIEAGNNQYFVALPFESAFAKFSVTTSDLIPKSLRDKYPDVRIYQATHVRYSSTQASIVIADGVASMMITSPGKAEYVQQLSLSDPHKFIVQKFGMGREKYEFVETPPMDDGDTSAILSTKALETAPTGRRIYRIAIATTAEYTKFHNGKANVFAAISETLGHVNQIYSQEFNINFRLVENTDELWFENPSEDGYTNDDAKKLTQENQAIMDSKIGNGNYDLGHVFATAKGGYATIGVLCSSRSKAKGASGLENPRGNEFDIDYVCHEIGHQLGARHIFNSNGCLDGARERRAAVEPGSGSTIMGYAGVCNDSENIQSNSHGYFNALNLREINAVLKRAVCASVMQNTNRIPSVKASAHEYWIPAATPFTLTATGDDADKDTLYYCWEQSDIYRRKSGLPLGIDDKKAPLFRSLPPMKAVSTRIFPQLEQILANSFEKTEVLSKLERDLNFVVTVRDGKGGFNFDNVVVHLARSTGFNIASHNEAISIAPGSQQFIKWSTGMSASPPVSCKLVNILLSLDGGTSFPIALALRTPNDGEQQVVIPPGIDNDSARIRIEAVDNIFFDISNSNFRIQDEGPSSAGF
jgi:hypothetical protein